MIAVVLVGGTGTRLRPLTLTVPKQVLPIVEVPMIERVLAHLEAHGVEEAVLSLGYLHGAFQALFPEGRCGRRSLPWPVGVSPCPSRRRWTPTLRSPSWAGLAAPLLAFMAPSASS